MSKDRKFNYKVADKARQLIGEWVAVRRKELGWSQETLAKMIDRPRQRVQEVETGRFQHIDTLIACIGCLRGELQIIWKDPDNDAPGFGPVEKN
ncbi:MAG TPA: helix-turn-helix transcriptional regulator [Niastella sp.]